MVTTPATKYEPHPLSEMFPPISQEDFIKLVADIKANGLLQPIVLYQGKILDGNNRYRACSLAGIEPRVEEFKSSDAQAYVVSVNIHRRHLSLDQRRDIIAKLLKADPSKSNRQIAETTKVSHHTVGDVRSELETTGQIAQLENTTGADGKKRRTKQKGERKAKIGSTPVQQYNAVEEKLIEKLKELDADEAREHVEITIAVLNETVEDIESIAQRAKTKAAKLGAVTPT